MTNPLAYEAGHVQEFYISVPKVFGNVSFSWQVENTYFDACSFLLYQAHFFALHKRKHHTQQKH